MIDHISLPVADFARSRAFYDRCLAALGYKVVMELTDSPAVGACGYGAAEGPLKPVFWIGAGEQATPPVTPHGQHIAFAASSRAAVDAFHREALAAGGHGQRPARSAAALSRRLLRRLRARPGRAPDRGRHATGRSEPEGAVRHGHGPGAASPGLPRPPWRPGPAVRQRRARDRRLPHPAAGQHGRRDRRRGCGGTSTEPGSAWGGWPRSGRCPRSGWSFWRPYRLIVGLGSGTQLGLALGVGLAHLLGRDEDARAIARLLERGARSGIGLATFLTGGFLVDGGRGAADEPPPIISRLGLPGDLAAAADAGREWAGLSGEVERAAFQHLPPFPAAAAADLCRLTVMRLLPAVAEADLGAAGLAIGELQRVVGDHFAPAQGARFTSPDVAEVLALDRGPGDRRRGPELVGTDRLRPPAGRSHRPALPRGDRGPGRAEPAPGRRRRPQPWGRDHAFVGRERDRLFLGTLVVDARCRVLVPAARQHLAGEAEQHLDHLVVARTRDDDPVRADCSDIAEVLDPEADIPGLAGVMAGSRRCATRSGGSHDERAQVHPALHHALEEREPVRRQHGGGCRLRGHRPLQRRGSQGDHRPGPGRDLLPRTPGR